MSRASKPQAEITCNDIRDAGYTLGRTLGEGRFSQVLLGTHIKSGEQFAVKVVEASALEGDEEAAEALRIEVEVLKRAARHPNIVALHAVVRTPAATYLCARHARTLWALLTAVSRELSVPTFARLRLRAA